MTTAQLVERLVYGASDYYWKALKKASLHEIQAALEIVETSGGVNLNRARSLRAELGRRAK